jgi:15-cis-phytoene synthase
MSGSSFFRSFALLPREKRRAMTALYAFARQTDDMGDSDTSSINSQDQTGQLLANCRTLEAWRAATARALLAGNPGSLAWLSEAACPGDMIPMATAILPALADAARRYEIPSQYLLDIIDGVLADQTQKRFHSFEQLEHYCYQVASTVGLACIHIWQFQTPLPLSAAIDCGVAFQITNILRDICEDAQRDRLYLPREFWARRGMTETDLFACQPTESMLAVMDDLSAKARARFISGWQVIEALHPDGKRMFSMMWRTYRLLLYRIDSDPAAALQKRVRLTATEKFKLAGSHFIGSLYRKLGDPTCDPRFRFFLES